MERFRRLTIVALLMSCMLLTPQAPASADIGPWSDAGDGRGPLAIRKIDIGHAGYNESTLEITFERPVDPSRLGKRDFFVVDFDHDADGRSDYWLYFVPGRRGGWRTFKYYPASRTFGALTYPFRKTSPNSIKINVWSHYSGAGGYFFRVFSFSNTGPRCARACIDGVPNSRWLLHDWTRPTIWRFDVPAFSASSTETPSVPVSWRVTDTGFSRLASATLLMRPHPGDTWVRVAGSRRTDRVKADVQVEQGQQLDFRLRATDGAGNRSNSSHYRTVVPFDDGSEANGARYTGLWNEVDSPGAYLRRSHVSRTPLDIFQFTGEAQRYCIFYRAGPEFGSAILSVGNRSSRIDMSRAPDGHMHCLEAEEAGSHTAMVRVESGIINIDGYWFE